MSVYTYETNIHLTWSEKYHSKSDDAVSQACAYINNNLSNPNQNVSEVCDAVSISVAHLIFQEYTSNYYTPHFPDTAAPFSPILPFAGH